jgi:hypothetical protein
MLDHHEDEDEGRQGCYCCHRAMTLRQRMIPNPLPLKSNVQQVMEEWWECTNPTCYANPQSKIPTPPARK